MRSLVKYAALSVVVMSSSYALAAGAKKAPAKKPADAPAAAAPAAPAASPAASAETSAPKKKHKVPYGMAGCGLGTLVISDNSTWPQVAVWFLNNSIAPQTSAITTGTSNCTEAMPEEAARQEQETFVQVNFSNLSKEAAQGNGQILSAMAELLGCAENGDDSAFAQLSADRYSAIFSDAQPSAVVNNYKREIGMNPALKGTCVRAG